MLFNFSDEVFNIFKAYDIRGKVGSELTPELAEAVGIAFGNWLPENGPVAIGYDMRPDSKELAESLIKGLNLSGRDVINIGLVPSDVIYFAVGSLNCAGGAVVTASHNPGEYNGIKLCREGAGGISIESGLQEIRDLIKFNKLKQSDKPGTTTKQDVKNAWIQHVLSFVEINNMKPFKIAVDAGNGMAGAVIPILQKYLPWQVTEMYYELDGTFPNHPASPIEIENLQDLIKKIKEEELDFGIAFDGDGDRAFLVDELGNQISGSTLTAILADYYLKLGPGSTIICNAICGKDAKDVVLRNGGKFVRSKVGHSFIKTDMRIYDAVFAGEHSGHYYFRDNFYADSGLIAAVVAAYALGLSGKKLSEFASRYSTYPSIQETNFEVEDKQAVIDRVKAEFRDEHIDELDGISVTFTSGAWLNLRPSNTEPLLRLNAEANSRTELDKIVSKVKDIVEASVQ
ncbi:MAG TPA: phosphomannomutase/phosphoglucomutase [Candidatus Saccharibacteria bacterium]|nr:phosphomannomutase/phosphoglucomutase [Candidatus Saccharibacteria bacterium]